MYVYIHILFTHIYAHVFCSIPTNRHSLIMGCGGAWALLFALLCLLGCVSACAVLHFLHVVTVLAGLGASSGRYREKKQQMAVSLMVHAIYSMHNNLRHNPHHGEVRQTMARIAEEVGVSWSFRNAWADVFGWRLRSAARPPRR